VNAHVLVCFLAYAMYRTLDRLAKANHLNMTARRVLDALAGIKSGDVILPLVDGRELRLRRVSRPDPHQAEILTRLGLDLPERIGTDTVHVPGVVQTRPWPLLITGNLGQSDAVYCATSARFTNSQSVIPGEIPGSLRGRLLPVTPVIR
jgi:hypothetical protein